MTDKSLEHTMSNLERQAREADVSDKQDVVKRLNRLIAAVDPRQAYRFAGSDDDDLLFDNVPV